MSSDFVIYTATNSPVVAKAKTQDGGQVLFLGQKGLDGLPTSVSRVITAAQDPVKQLFFDYDAQGRLVSATGNDRSRATFTWTSNAIGSITLTTANGAQREIATTFAGAAPLSIGSPNLAVRMWSIPAPKQQKDFASDACSAIGRALAAICSLNDHLPALLLTACAGAAVASGEFAPAVFRVCALGSDALLAICVAVRAGGTAGGTAVSTLCLWVVDQLPPPPPPDPPASPSCGYTLRPTSQEVARSGGNNFSFAITRMFSTTDNTSLCAWQAAASDPSWIRLPTTTGTESSTLFYNVDANISPQIRLGAIVVTWTGGGAAQLSITQESTSTTFRLSGSLVNGASINGAVAIDIRAGTVTAGTVTIGAPDSVTLTRALSGPVTRNSDGAVIAMQIQILPPTGSPNLILTLPVTSLVNYGGGTVCATVCNKAGDSGLVYSSNTVVAVASATLTPE